MSRTAQHETRISDIDYKPDMYGSMVERSELRDVRAELREDIIRLQERMRVVATKDDISSLKEFIRDEVSQTEIKTLKQFVKTWTTGAGIAIPCLTALIAALISVLLA